MKIFILLSFILLQGKLALGQPGDFSHGSKGLRLTDDAVCKDLGKDTCTSSSIKSLCPQMCGGGGRNRNFGMDSSLTKLMEPVLKATDNLKLSLKEAKQINQLLDEIEEKMKHKNTTEPEKVIQIRATSCADRRLVKEREYGLTRTKIFPFSHRRYRGHHYHHDRYNSHHRHGDDSDGDVGVSNHHHNRYNSHHRHGNYSDDGVDVLCDQNRDGGGWTIIQMRRDVYPQENFYRDWYDYVEGFGQLDGEFWIGLEVIHALTTEDTMELHIYLEDWEGGRRWAKYTTFRVHSDSEQYKLDISGYSGDAGDSMKYHNTRKFYTKDKDNKHTCAQTRKGGWWYEACESANLNGQQHRGMTNDRNNNQGINWHEWRGRLYSLKAVTMKIRPRHMYG